MALSMVTAAVYLRGIRGVVITAPFWTVLVASALVPIGGRVVVDWLPTVAHWLLRVALRQDRYLSRPLKPRPVGTLGAAR